MFQVLTNDGLPSKICELCQEKLRQFYEFKLMCLESNALLNRYKNDIDASSTGLGDFRKKFNISFVNIKIEPHNVEVLNSESTSVEDSQNCIRLSELSNNTFSSAKCYDKYQALPLELNFVEVGNDKTNFNGEIITTTAVKYDESNKCKNEAEDELNDNEENYSEEERSVGETQLKSVDKPYICNFCNNSFTLKVELTYHLLKHTGRKQYKCEICNMSFLYLNGLKSHTVKHNNVKPMQCNICFKKFITEKWFKNHSNVHNRKFNCDKCGKEFDSRTSLCTHSTVHTEERPYTCNVCRKSFKCKSSCTSHRKSHEGYRVVCNICGKNYANNTVLINHMRLHTGEKPFKCQLCDKSFADKTALRTHIVSHSDVRGQKCSYCGIEFKYKSYLYTHMKRKHSDVLFDEKNIVDNDMVTNN